MSRFIESVCYSEGNYHLLDLHQERVERTFKHFFSLTIPFNLEAHLPKLDLSGTYKVRVVYDNQSVDVEFAEYVPREIKTLKIVNGKQVTYDFKYEDRTSLTDLFGTRGVADDVVIVKEGLITDSSYANLVFWDGSTWITPKSPLLNGVKRQHYLRLGLVAESDVFLSDLTRFEKVGLINAMLDLGDVEVAIARVHK